MRRKQKRELKANDEKHVTIKLDNSARAIFTLKQVKDREISSRIEIEIEKPAWKDLQK